jgi:hypothetical protein
LVCPRPPQPGKREKAVFEDEVMSHSFPHTDLERIMSAFRYDAHPQAMMVAAFGALGSFHAEANPALQGQKLYTAGTEASLQAMDKQIYRLIGKAPTLAAMAYRVRQGRPFNRPPSGLSYAASFLYQIDKLGEMVGPDGAPQPFSVHPVFERAIDILLCVERLSASTGAITDQRLSTASCTPTTSSTRALPPPSPSAALESTPTARSRAFFMARGLTILASPSLTKAPFQRCDRRSLRPPAWRCQRGRDPHAAINRQRREHPDVHR